MKKEQPFYNQIRPSHPPAADEKAGFFYHIPVPQNDRRFFGPPRRAAPTVLFQSGHLPLRGAPSSLPLEGEVAFAKQMTVGGQARREVIVKSEE